MTKPRGDHLIILFTYFAQAPPWASVKGWSNYVKCTVQLCSIEMHNTGIAEDFFWRALCTYMYPWDFRLEVCSVCLCLQSASFHNRSIIDLDQEGLISDPIYSKMEWKQSSRVYPVKSTQRGIFKFWIAISCCYAIAHYQLNSKHAAMNIFTTNFLIALFSISGWQESLFYNIVLMNYDSIWFGSFRGTQEWLLRFSRYALVQGIKEIL